MKNVPTSGTKPEKRMAAILRYLKYTGFLTNYPLQFKCRTYTIVPDIVYLKSKIAVYIHGRFWHLPSKNKSRALRMKKDESALECLKNNGWKTLVVFDDEVNAAYKYFKDNTKLKYKAAYDKIVGEVKATLE